MPKVKSNGRAAKATKTTKGTRAVPLLPHPCKGCMTHPCVCKAEAAEAKAVVEARAKAAEATATLRAVMAPVTLPALKSVVLVHDGHKGEQWTFTQLPGTEVLVQYHAPRRLTKELKTAAEAKVLWNALRQAGWHQF